jgi:hypothetical protein
MEGDEAVTKEPHVTLMHAWLVLENHDRRGGRTLPAGSLELTKFIFRCNASSRGEKV